MAVQPDHMERSAAKNLALRWLGRNSLGEKLAKFAIVLILSFWLLLLAGGRLLVSSIDQREQAFAQWLSQRLNVEVGIGALRGTWQALDPHFEISDLTLSSAEGKAVALSHAHLRIDTMASLLRWQIVFHHLEVEQLELHLNSDDSGLLSIRGLSSNESEPMQLAPILETLAYSREMKFDATQINIKRAGLAQKLQLKFNTFQIAHSSQLDFYNRMQGEIEVSFAEQVGHISLGLDATKPSALSPMQQSSYLQIENFPLATLQLFMPAEQTVWSGLLNSQFWFSTEQKQHNVWGALAVVDAQINNRAGLPLNANLDFSWAGRSEDSWQAVIDNIIVSNSARQWQSPKWQLSSLASAQGVDIEFSSFDISGFNQVLIESQIFVDKSQEVFSAMNLQGQLGHSRVQLQKQPQFEMALVSSVNEFSMHSYNGSPALFDLSAQLWADTHGLYVQTKNEAARFSFSKYYPDIWSLADVEGLFQLGWDERGMSLAANIAAKMEDGIKAEIDFYIDLANDLDKRTYSMVLDVADAPALMQKNMCQIMFRSRHEIG